MISANPEATADFTYETISGNKRLQLKARFLTEAELMRHEQTVRDRIIGKQMSEPDTLAARDELLALGIVGMTVDQLKAELTMRDLYQLATGYTEAIDVQEYELGKSRSRPAFIVVTPAVGVAATAATIPQTASATPQADPVPSSSPA